jgi:hypothetical protein
MRYNGESRTDSTVVLVRPMSASSRSSSSRSSLYWRRRSNTRTIPVSGASGIFHQRTSERDSDRALDGAFMVKVGLEMVLPQGMFHLRIGAKQHLAAGAHRAVVNVPSGLCIIPAAGTQAVARKHQLMSRDGDSRASSGGAGLGGSSPAAEAMPRCRTGFRITASRCDSKARLLRGFPEQRRRVDRLGEERCPGR